MSLLRAVSNLCDQVVDDPKLETLHATAERGSAKLAAPLVVAVCGQVSAGKSTMVNALVGRRVAQTGPGETTEVNWWYRRGSPERVIVTRKDGSRIEFALTPGVALPRVPDIDADALEAITVMLDHELLDEIVTVDAPGLFSPTQERSARAAELLARRTIGVTEAADALLYLSHEVPGAQRDVAVMEGFQDPFSLLRKAPTNALMLLSRADQLWSPGASEHPLEIGDRLLAGHRAELSSKVWDAAPVVGLLAETARVAGGLNDTMVADLHALARDPARRRRVLSRRALLDGEVAGVPVERRDQLLTRLGSFGLVRALELIDSGRGELAQLRDGLLDASGFSAAATLIRTTFRERSELIRADSVLSSLRQQAMARAGTLDEPSVSGVLAAVERIRLSRAGLGLRQLQALRMSCDPAVRLPADTRNELRRLLGERSAATRLGCEQDVSTEILLAVVRERRRYWKGIAATVPCSPDRRFVAQEAARAYEQVGTDLRRHARPALAGQTGT